MQQAELMVKENAKKIQRNFYINKYNLIIFLEENF